MTRKLYIINNGMKDLRGHYFETSVSIAEASHSLGLTPLLAGHVTCPSEIIPGNLEFHAAFTTDHWMVEPPPRQPEVAGLRCDPALLAANTIEDLIAGKIRFHDYIEARFDPPGAPAPHVDEQASLTFKRKLKRIVKGLLPPLILTSRPYVKRLLRQLFPPVAWRGLKAIAARFRDSGLPGTQAVSQPAEEPRAKIDMVNEFEYSRRFQHDLERLLCLTGCTAADHVFLPTAHARELCAILDLMSRWPVESQPTFHLEFRHSLALSGDGTLTESHGYCSANAVFFGIARTFPVVKNIRVYTDSTGLSEEYERISGLEFGVLPIPFRAGLLTNRSRGDGPLCLGYYGDVRDEKGFHWLPELVEGMLEDYVKTGRVRFLIQASLVHPEHEPLSKKALDKLKTYPDDWVRLVALDGPLSAARYFQLVSETDLLLCPYDPMCYRNRTSGTLTEAIASGIPTIVPHGSWLASQQPFGSGKTFLDLKAFIDGVRMICDEYPSFHSNAKAGRLAWLAHHSPERLVRALLDTPLEDRSSHEMVA